jgi:hypothetical protein
MVPMTPNDRSSLDVASDQLIRWPRFRILTVVDDCTRDCLAPVTDTSRSGIRVARGARLTSPPQARRIDTSRSLNTASRSAPTAQQKRVRLGVIHVG